MVSQQSFACLALCLALISPLAVTAEKDVSATFRVMLQADSPEAFLTIVKNVQESGAEITHRLPIINAVGARITADQMDRITDSDSIARLIDDLDAVAPQPEEPANASDCDTAGALDLTYRDSAVHWRLYNKGDVPRALTGISVSTPDDLGEPETILWAGDPLELKSTTDSESGISTHFTPVSPTVIQERTNLELSLGFHEGVNAQEHPQHDFTLEVEFGDACSVELIPGYPDNQTDTHYPTVTGADLLHGYGITGDGVTVAVLDSGLWETEPLAMNTRGEPRVIARYDAVSDRPGVAFDESGHGTHMTSIIAQSGRAGVEETRRFRGIAPDVQLVSIKAFEADGQGDFLNIVRGLQWIYDNRAKYGIDVLNLSFAARPRWPYWLDPINQAIMRLWQAGVVVVAAAGNEGPDRMTVGSPGNLPYIITVGSVTDSWTTDTENDDYIPDFSSRGPTPSGHIKPDLVAPGGHMSGFTRPGSTLLEEFPEYLLLSGDFVMTGTSQSAAVVSGLVALLLQTDPTLSPDDVKCMLMSSANPAINRDGKLSYSPFQQGSGYVSIQRAITLGETGCGNAGMDIESDIRGENFYQGPAVLEDIDNPTLPDLELIFDGDTSEKGISQDRRWGIKAHVERLDASDTEENSAVPDWRQLYDNEKEIIDNLRAGN